MSLRQRQWARKAYAALIEQLGGRCSHCGSTDDLSIHHPHGRDWHLNRVEWSARVSIYRREAKEGKLGVLCMQCNRTLGKPHAIELEAAAGDAQLLDEGRQMVLGTDAFVEETGRSYLPSDSPDAPF